MPRLLSLMLIMVLSAKLLFALGFGLYFMAFRTQVAAERCINISKPGSRCKGSCYFMQKMKSVEAEQNQQGITPELPMEAATSGAKHRG